MKKRIFFLPVLLVCLILLSSCSVFDPLFNGGGERKTVEGQSAREALDGFLGELKAKRYKTAAGYTWEESLYAVDMTEDERVEELKKIAKNNPLKKFSVGDMTTVADDMVLFEVKLTYEDGVKTEEILMVNRDGVWYNSIDRYFKKEAFNQNLEPVGGKVTFSNVNVYYYTDKIKITADVTNKTGKDISLGWAKRSVVTLTTHEGTFTSEFNANIRLKNEEKQVFTMRFAGAKGTPLSFEINEIFDLMENGVPPMGAESYTVSAELGK